VAKWPVKCFKNKELAVCQPAEPSDKVAKPPLEPSAGACEGLPCRRCGL